MSTDSPRHKSVNRVALPFMSAVAISIGLALSTLIAAHSWKEVRKKPEKNNIRITGSARKRIVSDLIEWNASVEAQGADRTAAYVALKSGTEKVVAFLAAQGVMVGEIQTESASIREEFDIIKEDKVLPGTNVPLRSERKESKGFKAHQVVGVSSTDIPRIEKVSREITTLLEQGVDVTSHEPNYYYTRLGELKLEMLSEAAKDARARAENILSSAGNTSVGKLVYANMGIININAANSTETSSEGNNDTSSRDKDIITIIHAEFQVK